MPGCGFWADGAGAASATGDGEKIARLMLCRLALEPPSPRAFSVEPALQYLGERLGGFGGMVGVLVDGRWSASCNTPLMGVAWRGAGMAAPRVELVSSTAPG